jgi:hypothetical protein
MSVTFTRQRTFAKTVLCTAGTAHRLGDLMAANGYSRTADSWNGTQLALTAPASVSLFYGGHSDVDETDGNAIPADVTRFLTANKGVIDPDSWYVFIPGASPADDQSIGIHFEAL